MNEKAKMEIVRSFFASISGNSESEFDDAMTKVLLKVVEEETTAATKAQEEMEKSVEIFNELGK